MEAPSTGSNLPEIALRPTRVGERLVEGGDLFNTDEYLSKGELDERTVTILRRQQTIGPLTPWNYRNAIGRRPPGTIGQGFTEAYLREMKIVEDDDGAAPTKPKPAAAPKAAPKPARVAKELVTVEYKGRLIVPVKVGRFVQIEVTSKAGELLRNKRFRKADTAKAFIDSLPPAEDSPPDPETKPAQEEQTHGDDLQSGAL